MNILLNNPPVEFRGCPFWSLNDRLEPVEMIRQVEEFYQAGMGGFFLHSRIGLITEYLGSEWIEALRAAIEKAGELGLKAWLYDEDKWPSGYAGGTVPMAFPEFRGQVLARQPADKAPPSTSELISEINGWKYFIVTVEPGVEWFNGGCYIDLMNPEAVRAFIDSTHEKYKAAFGEFFGNVIPGIFTDEPIMRQREGWFQFQGEYIPYSPYLKERYEKYYGESPFMHLPALFEDVLDAEKYRYRYWKSATEQFVDAYTRQIGEWCEQNKLKLTGHFMYEDSIETQTRWIGKAMPHYEYMQVPGIDHLGLNINNIITAKQCSSVAAQQGKKQVLSEMFGCAGQNMTFEDRKWIAGWHGVMGINFVCHHLSLYSLRGCRKRDYPPTFSAHQPYWSENKAVEDWQARLSWILSQGTRLSDFLIIHPAESGWCLQIGAQADEKVKGLDKQLKELLDGMFQAHRDFDFGDEAFIADKAALEGTQLRVGEVCYRAVIIPPMLTLRASTLELLKNFRQAGGCILCYGLMPDLLDGEYSDDSAKILNELCCAGSYNIDDFIRLLEKFCPQDIRFSGLNHQNIMIQRRRDEQGDSLILFNCSRHDCAEIIIDGSVLLEEFDLETGKTSILNSVQCKLAPARTRIFRLGEAVCCSKPCGKTREFLKITGPWQIECDSPNVLPLDFAEWSLDNREWYPAEPVIGLKMRLDSQAYSGPLYLRYSFVNQLGNAKEIAFAAELPPDTLLYVNGKPLLSGKEKFLDHSILQTDISGLLRKDVNIIQFRVDYIYAEPANLACPERRYGTELEAAWLAGNFGVESTVTTDLILPEKVSHDVWDNKLPDRRVVRIGHDLRIVDGVKTTRGELTASGMPFYAGTVRLYREFELESPVDCTLVFDVLDAITARVFINDEAIEGLFQGRSSEAELKSVLKAGRNKICVELKNSLRNMLGPHHHTMGELASVGPYSFISRDFAEGKYLPETEWSIPEKRLRQKSWTDDYFVVRFGLHEGVKLITRE